MRLDHEKCEMFVSNMVKSGDLGVEGLCCGMKSLLHSQAEFFTRLGKGSVTDVLKL